jgi:uncharacterized spore protein YtfJ
MEGSINEVVDSVRQESEARIRALLGIVSAADSVKVFGQPVSSGGYTVIPAAEVASGGGFGSGMGFGGPPRHRMKAHDGSPAPVAAAAPGGEAGGEDMQGAGGGGGGGGGAMARPVAAIVIGPEGVAVRPVFDVTKLALTALGALGTAVVLGLKLWSKRR